LDPRRAGSQLGLGIALLHLNQPEAALNALEKCLERQPFREGALRAKALALHLLGRDGESLALYEKLLARDPQSEELLGNMTPLAIGQGNYDLLIQCSRRLLEIRPVSPVALECLALASMARRDYEGALQSCKTLLEAHPDHFAGWFNRGVALQKLGRFDEAAD